jgi:hypothetical protein
MVVRLRSIWMLVMSFCFAESAGGVRVEVEDVGLPDS